MASCAILLTFAAYRSVLDPTACRALCAWRDSSLLHSTTLPNVWGSVSPPLRLPIVFRRQCAAGRIDSVLAHRCFPDESCFFRITGLYRQYLWIGNAICQSPHPGLRSLLVGFPDPMLSPLRGFRGESCRLGHHVRLQDHLYHVDRPFLLEIGDRFIV